jgi:GH43 family beta-xylosidase
MGIRCEVCDDFLNIFQLSKLCDNCYKIRTIVKVYNSNVILKHLENHFLIKSELIDIKEDKISNETILKDINDRDIETVNKKLFFCDTKNICDDNNTMKNLNKNLLDDLKEKLKYHSNNMMDTIKENDEID